MEIGFVNTVTNVTNVTLEALSVFQSPPKGLASIPVEGRCEKIGSPCRSSLLSDRPPFSKGGLEGGIHC